MSVSLSEHLPLLAEAPDGIKKLRGLILELAVRGKLVPQDPNDEPAGELLKRIAAEKARLIADGKIKKGNPLPKIGEVETPFELPDGWGWARLGKIGTIGSSSRVHQKDWVAEGVPFYRAREIVKLSNFGFVDNDLFITEEHYRILSESGLVPEVRDLMITGVGTIGVPYIVKATDRFYFKDASVLIFKNHHNLCSEFISLLMKSPYWIDQIHAQSMGTTVHTLTISRANEVPVALPPLPEQHRIVAKVEELMALCDRMGTEQADAEAAHTTLVQTLLGTLTQSRDAAELAANWQRLSQHFDTLFTTEKSLDALKQTILQLAVMGKLVPQDPKDEPASELLKRIATEKARLVAEGKIKQGKPLPLVGEDEKPFKLPAGWEWVRFADIIRVCSKLVKPEDFMDSFQVAPDCIEKGTGKLLERRTVRESGVRGPNQRFYSGQLLYSKIRPSLSKAVLVDFDGLCSADMYPLETFIDKQFLLTEILSEVFLSQVRIAENRIKMPKLNQESLAFFMMALPPLAEQHRIVAKGDKLMALCDSLKADLAESRARQARLATTLIESALQAA